MSEAKLRQKYSWSDIRDAYAEGARDAAKVISFRTPGPTADLSEEHIMGAAYKYMAEAPSTYPSDV